MVYCIHLTHEGSHAVIHFYETRKLRGVVHAPSNNLQAQLHLDDVNRRCLTLFL